MSRRLFILFLFYPFLIQAQDLPYAKQLVDTLTSPYFEGRGYINDGDRKAALFIAEEFRKFKTDSMTTGYFQPLQFPVNTFPDAMELMINDKPLKAGADYITDPASAAAKGTYSIVYVETPPAQTDAKLVKNKFVMIDKSKAITKEVGESLNAWKKNILGAKGLLIIEEKKLTWGVSTDQLPFPVIHILQQSVPAGADKIRINMQAKMLKEHATQNVISVVKGSKDPETYIVFSAHYDHLGRMGKEAYFPGANDNASGISMLLNLVKYYSKPENKPPVSIAFIAFCGEEAGLIGSYYYTEKPLFPLSKIRFLVNMDLLGTGDDGMMVVNGSIYKKEFSMLQAINDTMHYVKSVGIRGKAQNSDHYYFAEKDVPCFFFYTLGGITAYHDIYDVSSTLPFTDFEDVFRLTRDFTDQLMKEE